MSLSNPSRSKITHSNAQEIRLTPQDELISTTNTRVAGLLPMLTNALQKSQATVLTN